MTSPNLLRLCKQIQFRLSTYTWRGRDEAVDVLESLLEDHYDDFVAAIEQEERALVVTPQEAA